MTEAKNTPVTWILTAVVLGWGGWQALSAWTAAPPPPASGGAASGEHSEGPSAPPASPTAAAEEAGGADRAGDWVERAVAASTEDLRGASLEAALPLERLDAWTWQGITEVDPDGERRPYRGRVTLRVGPEARVDFPVRDGRAELALHPELQRVLVSTGKVVVTFAGHSARTLSVPWLAQLGTPQVLEHTTTSTATFGRLRNPSAIGVRARVWAGHQVDGKWEVGEPSPHGRVDLVLPAGGVVDFRVEYAAGKGELGSPKAELVLQSATVKPPGSR